MLGFTQNLTIRRMSTSGFGNSAATGALGSVARRAMLVSVFMRATLPRAPRAWPIERCYHSGTL